MMDEQTNLDDFDDTIEFDNPHGITRENVWKKIWLDPWPSLRFAVHEMPDKYTHLLFIVAAIANSVGAATYAPDSMLTMAAATGFSILFLYCFALVYTYLLAKIGQKMGGQGSVYHIRKAIAWSYLPLAVGVVFSLSEFIMAIANYHLSNFPLSAYLAPTLLFLRFILSLWALFIAVNAVMLIHDFTVWRAIGNMLLCVLVVLIVFAIVSGATFIFSDLFGNFR